MSEKKKSRAYRERTYGYKRKLMTQDGKPIEELGEFYQVALGQDNVRLLPVNLDKFNKAWEEIGEKPVDPEWTLVVPLTVVSEKIETGETKKEKSSSLKTQPGGPADLDAITAKVKAVKEKLAAKREEK